MGVRLKNVQAQYNLAEGELIKWDPERGDGEVFLEESGTTYATTPVTMELVEDHGEQPSVTQQHTATSEFVLRSALQLGGGCLGQANAPGGATSHDMALKPGDQICLQNLQDYPHMNGLEGELMQWREDRGHWEVLLRNGTKHALRPENVAAVHPATIPPPTPSAVRSLLPDGVQRASDGLPGHPPGAHAWEPMPGIGARLQNLSDRSDLNGQEVVIEYLSDEQFDTAEKCWAVKLLSDGQQHAVRREHLAPPSTDPTGFSIQPQLADCPAEAHAPLPAALAAHALTASSETLSTSASTHQAAQQPFAPSFLPGAATPEPLLPGRKVEIVGLRNHPGFNGQRTAILACLDNGCYEVQNPHYVAEGTPAQRIQIRYENLRPL